MIPRTSIEEANRHLNLLHSRVHELEQTVSTQSDALQAKEEELQSKVDEISSVKNSEIESIRRKLRESEQTVVILQRQIQQKDQVIENLQHNSAAMEVLLNHKASVQQLFYAMKEAEKSMKDTGTSELSRRGSSTEQKESQLLNGFGGISSSSEPYSDKKIDSQNKSGESKPKSNSKRLGGKEFYL